MSIAQRYAGFLRREAVGMPLMKRKATQQAAHWAGDVNFRHWDSPLTGE